LKHGSLFSGGGGFDLAAEMVGWQNVFHCERDKFCQRILKHYWPKAKTFTDIKEFNAKAFKGKIDIITGGFPCQPFSTAGKRKGTADDRYLWPDMLRVIREIRPRWVVGENVYGLVNWNEGMVFDQVQSDLEAQGYKIAAFVLPAAGINAPHQRYRVWIIGYNPEYGSKRDKEDHPDTGGAGRHRPSPGGKAAAGRKCRQCKHVVCLCETQLEEAGPNADGNGRKRSHSKYEKQPGQTRQHAQCHLKPMGKDASHTNSKRPELETEIRKLARGRPRFRTTGTGWRNWPTQSPLCGRDDGLPARLDGVTFQGWKRQSLKMYGNAIVPQIAVRIFKAINEYEAM